jgi:hypothetical protein
MLEEKKGFLLTFVFLFFTANCIVMALDEHLPNGDKTILAIQLVSPSCFFKSISGLAPKI